MDVEHIIGRLEEAVGNLNKGIDRLIFGIKEDKRDTDKKIEELRADFVKYIKQNDERLSRGNKRMDGLQLAIGAMALLIVGYVVFSFTSDWKTTGISIGVIVIAAISRKFIG